MKWFASTLATLIGLCVIVGVVAFLTVFGTAIGALLLIVVIGGCLLFGTKEWLDERSAARQHKQRAR